MQCDYCFYCDEAKKRKQASYGMMSAETLKNVIRKALLYADGSCTIAFQGGEPTLRGLNFFHQAVSYIERYNKKQIQVNLAIQTNGFDINDEWCRFLKRNNFLVGLSVDGVKSTHDQYRHDKSGGDTYEQILKTAELFDRFEVEYNILTVVNDQTALKAAEIYEAYKRRGWHYQQYIACLDPLGEKRGETRYALTPRQYGQFLVALFELWFRDWRKGKQPYIRQFENYIAILMNQPVESCEQGGRCGIQNVVEADGSVYPCDFYVLDDYCLGNLNRHNMLEIEKERRNIGFCSRSNDYSAECRTCDWFFICRAGCYRNREGAVNNYFCESYKMLFQSCYGKMKQIAAYLL